MNNTVKVLVAGAAIIALSLHSDLVTAQTASQTVANSEASAATSSPQVPIDGCRVSKLIGANVFNDSGQAIGTVDDFFVTQDGKVPQAVLSVGGFLGVGTRLVVVAYDSFKITDSQVTYPNATMDRLNALPEFHYPQEPHP